MPFRFNFSAVNIASYGVREQVQLASRTKVDSHFTGKV